MSKLRTNNYNSKLKTDLKHRSFQFSINLIQYSQTLPNKKIYWLLTDQLLRAGTSIGANIIEAKAASSKRDFIKFFEISLKSANETIYWLFLIKEGQLDSSDALEVLISEARQLAAMLGSSLLTMKGKRKF